jgi:hypothetical protein
VFDRDFYGRFGKAKAEKNLSLGLLDRQRFLYRLRRVVILVVVSVVRVVGQLLLS